MTLLDAGEADGRVRGLRERIDQLQDGVRLGEEVVLGGGASLARAQEALHALMRRIAAQGHAAQRLLKRAGQPGGRIGALRVVIHAQRVRGADLAGAL